MPTVTLNRKVFEDLVGKKLPTEELGNRISMLGTDLESLDDKEIHVEIFPNRPDMLSEQGFARAFSSFIGVKTGLSSFTAQSSGEKLIVEKSLPKEWPYAFACIIKNLKFTDERIREVIQIQEKLGTTMLRSRKKGGIGLYPLDKITFPIKFVGMNPDEITFKPLEYGSVITGRQILSKHPTGRTYASICENWNKFPVFVDANNVIMSMPPIINSHDVGKIDETTTEVFLEITGTDPLILRKALTIMATSLAGMGGTIHTIECVQQDGKKLVMPDLEPSTMKFDLEYCNRWLGLGLHEKKAKELLGKMGYGWKNGSVLIPAYRADIMHQVDLFEDVAIAYGYENVKEEIPTVSTIGEEDPLTIFKRRVSRILTGVGCLELNTYHVSSKRDQCERMNTSVDLVSMKNAVNEEYTVLRSWLSPLVMDVLSRNTHNEYPQHLFEIGKVFRRVKDTETGIGESERLCAAVCEGDADYTKVRQILEYLMRLLDVKCTIAEAEHESFIPGRIGSVFLGNKNIGFIGEIHPSVLENWGLEMPVALFEINLEALFELVMKE